MSNREQWKKAETELRIFVEQLSKLPFRQISHWPEWPAIPAINLGTLAEFKDFKITPMKDTLTKGTVRIAVQMYKHHFLGVGSMTADGFLMEPNGTVSWLKEEELWENNLKTPNTSAQSDALTRAAGFNR